MNGSINTLWPSLLPPVCDHLWFTADFPKNEEAELAILEDELEQEKLHLQDQGAVFKSIDFFQCPVYDYFSLLKRPRLGKYGTIKC